MTDREMTEAIAALNPAIGCPNCPYLTDSKIILAMVQTVVTTPEEKVKYVDHLNAVAKGMFPVARHHAEALLKTKGLWKE